MNIVTAALYSTGSTYLGYMAYEVYHQKGNIQRTILYGGVGAIIGTKVVERLVTFFRNPQEANLHDPNL